MNQKQRVHVLYSGNVQGVGFRFVAQRAAFRMGITGFAKNLPNGNVEVVCEGNREQLESFLENINEDMHGYINGSRVEWEPARGEFTSFGIRFG